MTVAEGWDTYARQRRTNKGVGDVWSKPRRIGVDVDRPEDVVPYLDREVFTPFLDTSEVQHWDIYHYLVELQRVLKPGGKALIQHSHTFSELGWKEFRREVPAATASR